MRHRNAQEAVFWQEGRAEYTEDELPGEVQTEDEQRHTTGLVTESAIDEQYVRNGPEDTGCQRQDVVQRHTGRNGDGLKAYLPEFRMRLAVNRRQRVSKLRYSCEQV